MKIIIHYSTEQTPQMFWWQLEDKAPKGERGDILYVSQEYSSEQACRANISLMKSIQKFTKVELCDGITGDLW